MIGHALVFIERGFYRLERSPYNEGKITAKERKGITEIVRLPKDEKKFFASWRLCVRLASPSSQRLVGN
jgi:hypothetical protein